MLFFHLLKSEVLPQTAKTRVLLDRYVENLYVCSHTLYSISGCRFFVLPFQYSLLLDKISNFDFEWNSLHRYFLVLEYNVVYIRENTIFSN